MKNMTDAEAKKLLDLRPVKFDYITEEDVTDCYGLIAEEVQNAGIEYPVFTHHDKRLDEDVPVLEFSETSSMGMSCVAIESEYVAGDTLTVSAGTSSAPGYNNSFALILNLISA